MTKSISLSIIKKPQLSDFVQEITVNFGALQHKWNELHGEDPVVFAVWESTYDVASDDDIFEQVHNLHEAFVNSLRFGTEMDSAKSLYAFVNLYESEIKSIIELEEYEQAKAKIAEQQKIIDRIEENYTKPNIIEDGYKLIKNLNK